MDGPWEKPLYFFNIHVHVGRRAFEKKSLYFEHALTYKTSLEMKTKYHEYEG